MKRLALLLTVVVSVAAHAKCEPNGIYLFPSPGAVIPINARWILEGAGSEVARVNQLVGAELILKAGEDQVAVSVQRGWTSTMKRVAVILKPAGELLPNKTYTLYLDKQLPGFKVLNSNAAPTLTWRTGAVADTAAPRFHAKPTVAEGYYNKDSDGVTRQLTIRTTLDEEGSAYVVATVQRARGNPARQVYAVPIKGGDALLGHDACSGSFAFDDGRAYKIWVDVYDSAGNKAVDKLPPIEAQAPRPQ